MRRAPPILSAKHLQAYLNEFTFRFNRRFYPFNAFRSLLGIAGNVEAPTFSARAQFFIPAELGRYGAIVGEEGQLRRCATS